MYRFILDPRQIAGAHALFDEDQARQMRRVLRLRPGDRVLVLDGRGRQYEVMLQEVSNARVTGQVIGQTEATGEPAARLTLFQSLLRREKFEWVMQKCTELGVAAFVPVITRRSLVRGDDVTNEKLARWRRIIKEAAEQSERGLLPEVQAPVALEDAFAQAQHYAKTILLWEGAAGAGVAPALAGLPAAPAVALFVGPEGGYDATEVEQAQVAGATVATLGPRILRTETAAVVASALVLHALGEMG